MERLFKLINILHNLHNHVKIINIKTTIYLTEKKRTIKLEFDKMILIIEGIGGIPVIDNFHDSSSLFKEYKMILRPDKTIIILLFAHGEYITLNFKTITNVIVETKDQK